jgi:hypothetical protein
MISLRKLLNSRWVGIQQQEIYGPMNHLEDASMLSDNDGLAKPLNLQLKFADPFAGLSVPVSLRANVDRHRANLLALVDSLGSAGVDEATIEKSIVDIVASYQAELIRNMKSLYRDAVDV